MGEGEGASEIGHRFGKWRIDDPALIKEIITKLKSQACVRRVKGRKATFMLRSGGRKWCLNIASNLTLSDPFDF